MVTSHLHHKPASVSAAGVCARVPVQLVEPAAYGAELATVSDLVNGGGELERVPLVHEDHCYTSLIARDEVV